MKRFRPLEIFAALGPVFIVAWGILLFTSTLSAPRIVLAATNASDCEITAPGQPVEPITLRVAMYPFTPDRIVLFQKIESIFECENPGVNVVLITSPNATVDYYRDDGDNEKGLQFVDADVYEIDTVLLTDFVALGKIAPIDLPDYDFAPEGVAAVSRDGKIFGVPHWLCGNFLFYRRADVAIREARSWKDLTAILTTRGQGLLVDFRGQSTLGEWYLTALASRVGLDAAQKEIIGGARVNEDALAYLKQILAACPLGYCRNQALHDNTGFYARAFVRGQGAVYIGYSESIYYGLRDAADNCLPTSGCLAEDEIAVRPLDTAKKEAGVGWVDALAIDAKLTGWKKELAIQFIRRLVSEDVYQSMLAPEWPYRSRYLLPARQDVKIANAPLYPEFFLAHSGRATGTLPHLNKRLREMGAKVTCGLPIDRNDEETRKACGLN